MNANSSKTLQKAGITSFPHYRKLVNNNHVYLVKINSATSAETLEILVQNDDDDECIYKYLKHNGLIKVEQFNYVTNAHRAMVLNWVNYYQAAKEETWIAAAKHFQQHSLKLLD